MLFPHIPLVLLSPTAATVTLALILIGFAGALVSLAYLGRQISIMPEARKLITGGPYAIVRHPLYFFEQMAILGIALEHTQPAAIVLFLAQVTLQVGRTVYEERVLTQAFPEYTAYSKRTPKLVPFFRWATRSRLK